MRAAYDIDFQTLTKSLLEIRVPSKYMHDVYKRCWETVATCLERSVSVYNIDGTVRVRAAPRQ